MRAKTTCFLVRELLFFEAAQRHVQVHFLAAQREVLGLNPHLIRTPIPTAVSSFFREAFFGEERGTCDGFVRTKDNLANSEKHILH